MSESLASLFARMLLDPRRSTADWAAFAAERERERFQEILRKTSQPRVIRRDIPMKDTD